jgi:hypothetical protein
MGFILGVFSDRLSTDPFLESSSVKLTFAKEFTLLLAKVSILSFFFGSSDNFSSYEFLLRIS